ncbi:MAG: Glycosyl hydrolase family 57 [Parcubacteria group bacterium GW2011_GWA2_44_12]|nr:MAG: Glycosyl hydrolase family 57 [Parcubacteria group bacterium GW2011_GWA2_44_12]
MPSICFYFQVHQPLRIKRYRIFNVGKDHEYFNESQPNNLNNRHILEKVARKSYLPTNALLLELLKTHPEFKISFSLSGVLLEQIEQHAPEVLHSFQELAATGRVEFLAETYYHSLSFLYSSDEFVSQVSLHHAKIKKLFCQSPKVFRNTELIYNNALAHTVEQMGYIGILAEGADHILEWRSPNFLYKPAGTKKIKLLLKNYKLSDDIAFRFSCHDWSEFPLTAPKFAQWVSALNGNAEVVNIFMDYETFGEHQWVETGIFDFLRHLPGEILKHPDNNFVTPSEAASRYNPTAVLDMAHFVSWADTERDLSAWLSNPMQNEAARQLFAMEPQILATENPLLVADWRKLQTSDHFYYMCTKWFADGDVHKYFNPYESPYDAFISFMNVLLDIKLRQEDCIKNKSNALFQ